jgi:CheY-like chemotaxis protein
LNSPSILIVDDHVDSGVICEEAFKVAGFTTEVVHSAEKALARLAHMVPDVVVLDLCLPRVAGTEVLRQIRADERLSDTFIIVASADPLFAEKLLSQVDLVLVKPIGFSQLRALAERLGGTVSAGR